jgi:hypothetical protein
MSFLIVAWKDTQGIEYATQTLYDPETETWLDWDGAKGMYVKREADHATP